MKTAVGRVIEALRFPVKSMAGERLAEAEVDWQGIEGDRQFAFYRKADGTRFPWLTAREVPALVLYSARFSEPAVPRTSPVEIVNPQGSVCDLRDPRLLQHLAEAGGCELGLMQSGRGIYDAMPISISTTGAMSAVAAAHRRPLDARRFRSNILIEADVLPSEWMGKTLSLGAEADGAELFVTNEIPRCAFITLDPDTARREPAVMRTVASAFGNLFGVYAVPARPGRLRVGDPVFFKG